MRELRVPHLVQACSDKVAALHRLTDRLDIDPLNCACIVDDTPDLPLDVGGGHGRRSGRRAPGGALRGALDREGEGRPRGGFVNWCDAMLRARAGRR